MAAQIPGILFSSPEVSTVIRILSEHIHSLTSLKTFRISSSKNHISLSLLDDDASLTFLKLFFSSLENYTLEKEASFMEETDLIPTLTIAEEKAENSSQVNFSSDIDIREIRQYINTLTAFAIQDIRDHFPNTSYAIIYRAIRSLSRKNLISSTGWGEYSVNK